MSRIKANLVEFQDFLGLSTLTMIFFSFYPKIEDWESESLQPKHYWRTVEIFSDKKQKGLVVDGIFIISFEQLAIIGQQASFLGSQVDRLRVKDSLRYVYYMKFTCRKYS